MSFDSPSSLSNRQPTVSSSQRTRSPIDTRDLQPRWKEQSSRHLQSVLSPLDTNIAKPPTPVKIDSPRHQEKSILTGPLSISRNLSLSRPRGLPSPAAATQPISAVSLTQSQGPLHIRSDGNSPTTSSQGISSPTSSSFDKISAAQLSILLDATREKEGQTKWESKSDRIHNLLNSNGPEVLAVFVRKSILFNHNTIFGSEHSYKHPSYTLLREKITEISWNPSRAFDIVDAIDASKEDFLQSFDLGHFISHFLPDFSSQLILGLAFSSSSKPNIRQEAHNFVSRTVVTLSQ